MTLCTSLPQGPNHASMNSVSYFSLSHNAGRPKEESLRRTTPAGQRAMICTRGYAYAGNFFVLSMGIRIPGHNSFFPTPPACPIPLRQLLEALQTIPDWTGLCALLRPPYIRTYYSIAHRYEQCHEMLPPTVVHACRKDKRWL